MELPSDLSGEYMPNDLSQMIGEPTGNLQQTAVKEPQFISPPESHFFVEKDEFSDLNRQVVSNGILSNVSGAPNIEIPVDIIVDSEISSEKPEEVSSRSSIKTESFSNSAATSSPVIEREDSIILQPILSVRSASITSDSEKQDCEGLKTQSKEADEASVFVETPGSALLINELGQTNKQSTEPETIIHEEVIVASRVPPISVSEKVEVPKQGKCCL